MDKNVFTREHPSSDKPARQRRRHPSWEEKSKERLDPCRTARVRFVLKNPVADTNETNSGELL